MAAAVEEEVVEEAGELEWVEVTDKEAERNKQAEKEHLMTKKDVQEEYS